MRYTAILQKGKESGYVAYVPALKGCVSQGPTKESAVANLREAAEAYMEALIADKLPIPAEDESETLEVEIA